MTHAKHHALAVIAVVSLSLAFAVTACGGAKPPPPDDRSSETSETRPEHKDTPGQGDLDRRDPISCEGKDSIELRRVRIDAPEVAISVRGSCRVVVIDSHIQADDVGIAITSTGTVEIHNSVLEGKSAAFAISGQGVLEARGTRFVGGRIIGDTGAFRDEGDNSWE